MNKSLDNINNVLSECYTAERVDAQASADLLASLLFNLTKVSSNKLVQVRDYDEIAKNGAFKYAGQRDTMFNEGLMPKDVYEGLKEQGIEKHIGPSYLKVKGLLTLQEPRTFFGKQLAYILKNYLAENPPEKEDGCIVVIPNMTGGAWVGDELRRQLGDKVNGYPVWPCTPYAREMRKVIETKDLEVKLADSVEGPLPAPEDTAAMVCVEELRTASETTRNALGDYRKFGYDDEAGVDLIAASVFDYGHPVGVERLERIGAGRIFAVGGDEFFRACSDGGYITDAQFETANEWLGDPWAFTRKVLPTLKK